MELTRNLSIYRLEAATSRLEDMAAPLDGTPQPNANAAASIKSGPPEPPKQVVAPPPPVVEPLPQSIKDFDDIIDTDVQKFVAMGQKIGGLVAEQVCCTILFPSGSSGR